MKIRIIPTVMLTILLNISFIIFAHPTAFSAPYDTEISDSSDSSDNTKMDSLMHISVSKENGLFLFGDISNDNIYGNGIAYDGSFFYVGYNNEKNTAGRIEKRSFDGVIVDTYAVDNCHFNSITYNLNDGFLYISNDKSILKLDTSFSLETVIIPDGVIGNIYGVSHDPITGKNYVFASDTIYECNKSFSSAIAKFPLGTLNLSAKQEALVFNNTVYTLENYPNRLIISSFQGDILETISLSGAIDGTKIGEVEGLEVCIYNGVPEIFLYSASYLYDYKCYNSLFSLGALSDGHNDFVIGPRNSRVPVCYYVDSAYMGKSTGSRIMPWKSIKEAFEHVYYGYTSTYQIIVENAHPIIDYPSEVYFIPAGNYEVEYRGLVPGELIRYKNSNVNLKFDTEQDCSIHFIRCDVSVTTDSHSAGHLTVYNDNSDVNINGNVNNVYNYNGCIQLNGQILNHYHCDSTGIILSDDSSLTQQKTIVFDKDSVIYLGWREGQNISGILSINTMGGIDENRSFFLTTFSDGEIIRVNYYELPTYRSPFPVDNIIMSDNRIGFVVQASSAGPTSATFTLFGSSAGRNINNSLMPFTLKVENYNS